MVSSLRRSLGWSPLVGLALLVSTSACGKDSTPPLTATSIAASVSSISLDAIGATQSVTATVRDQNGGTMTSVTPSFSIDASSVASVSGSGSATVTAVGNGSATLTIRAGNASTTVPVTVLQQSMVPSKVSGDAQTGAVGAALATAIKVKLVDRLGVAVAGRSVAFAPAADNGSANPATATTGSDGTASTIWTVGTAIGAQSMTATATGVTTPAIFRATATVGPPSIVTASAGDNQSATVGTALPVVLAARVTDAYSNPVSGVSVAFAATTGSGSITGSPATTNSEGVATAGTWTLGTTAGTQTVTATVTGVAPKSFSATARAAAASSIAISSGDGQSALAGATLANPLAVVVQDRYGNKVSGAAVTFAVTAGGGSITPSSVSTSATGVASGAFWRLGSQGGAQTATATTGTVSVTFTATTQSSYPITLRFFGPTMSAAAQAGFTNAVNRLSAAIVNAVSTVNLTNVDLSGCGISGLTGTINESTTGVIIYASVAPIDGAGSVLAQAGPCMIRGTSKLPALGVMQFDDADIQNYITTGRFEAVVLHEMNHVVGFGTIWTDKGLLLNPSLTSSGSSTGSTDPRFTGAAATSNCATVGGSGTKCTAATGVAVEATGGSGTADGHWRESLFDSELMTGFAESTPSMPWSVMSISSFQDLGYTVNLGAADSYTVPNLLTLARIRAQVEVEQGREVVHLPRFEVSATGVVRPIPRTVR